MHHPWHRRRPTLDCATLRYTYLLLKTMKSNNPKDFWKLINSNKKNKGKTNITMDILFDFFKDLNSGDDIDSDLDTNSNMDSDLDSNSDLDDNSDVNEIINGPITVDEIEKAIKRLKNNKASSDDNIINEYIKHSSQKMILLYVKIFNAIFNTGRMPEAWLKGTILPIYKNKGSSADPKNYRPITIVSCFGKLFTSVLNERLQVFSERFNLICENQAGFRKDYSTIDNIFLLHTLVSPSNLYKKKLYCIFIDFEKAFDKVWRNGLWNKMLQSQINGKMYNVIFNMYQSIKSRISFNGINSNYFPCDNGLRQGENLSPFLFSLYLNDLQDFMTQHNVRGLGSVSEELSNTFDLYLKLFIILYADDTILFSDCPKDLQLQLDIFCDYCRQFKLKVNISKTKCMTFSKGRNSNNQIFKFDGENIENVNQFNYLGIVFTKTCTFTEAKNNNVRKATVAMYDVLKKGRMYNLSVSCTYDLFDKIVVPILLYGCEVWGFTNIQVIERLHLKFCKMLLCLKKSTPNYMVYAELGIKPLLYNIKSRMVNYWARLIQYDENRYNCILYNLMLSKSNNNGITFKWLDFIKDVLNECGLTYVWNDQGLYNVNTKWLKELIKQILNDQYLQTLFSDMHNSSKASNYKLFKENCEFEEYLDILNNKERIVLCKFRTANHRLIIETGRWHNIDRENRICTLCDEGLVGDEFHYLLECSYFNDERKNLLGEDYCIRPNIIKYTNLMNTKNVPVLRNLCHFIKIIFAIACPP